MKLHELKRVPPVKPAQAFDIGDKAVLYYDKEFMSWRILAESCSPIVDPDLMLLALSEVRDLFLTPVGSLPRLPLMLAIVERMLEDMRSVKYTEEAEFWRREVVKLLSQLRRLLADPESLRAG